MSLSKVLSLFFIMLISGCQSLSINSGVPEDYFVVKINAPFDEGTIQKLELAMMQKMPDGFSAISIFFDKNSERSAAQIYDFFLKTYGMNAKLYTIEGGGPLYIQFEKYIPGECYSYTLNDFNWYKSTSREISKFSQAEICATNKNDNTYKAL